jgi:hypothetical protein
MERRPSIGLERKLTEELSVDHYTKGDAPNSAPSRWEMFKLLFFMSWPMTITVMHTLDNQISLLPFPSILPSLSPRVNVSRRF